MLALLIKLYRTDTKLSVRQLAARIGIDYTTLWRFENGKEVNGPSWVKLVRWVLTE